MKGEVMSVAQNQWYSTRTNELLF